MKQSHQFKVLGTGETMVNNPHAFSGSAEGTLETTTEEYDRRCPRNELKATTLSVTRKILVTSKHSECWTGKFCTKNPMPCLTPLPAFPLPTSAHQNETNEIQTLENKRGMWHSQCMKSRDKLVNFGWGRRPLRLWMYQNPVQPQNCKSHSKLIIIQAYKKATLFAKSLTK